MEKLNKISDMGWLDARNAGHYMRKHGYQYHRDDYRYSKPEGTDTPGKITSCGFMVVAVKEEQRISLCWKWCRANRPTFQIVNQAWYY